VISPRRRPAATFAQLSVGLLLGVGVLTACESQPSNKRVLLDLIESFDISETARQCMEDRINAYSNDALGDIADANEDFTLTPTGELRNPTDALAKFQADMARCVEENPGDVAPDASEPDGSEPATTLG
jgi:hypothetical protein